MGNIFKTLFGKSDEQGGTTKTNHKDPVCGMSVSGETINADYQGKTYYFCSEGCKAQFITKPGNFVD